MRKTSGCFSANIMTLPSRIPFPTITATSRLDLRTLLFMARCRWRSWLRHCPTSRKVAGSIPYGVTGILHWYNPSGRTMALGLTQPLTEMSTRNNSWWVKALSVSTFMCRLSWNLRASTSWNPQGPSMPVIGLLYLIHGRTCGLGSRWAASVERTMLKQAKQICQVREEIYAVRIFVFFITIKNLKLKNH
jgi:hypothetical protein